MFCLIVRLSNPKVNDTTVFLFTIKTTTTETTDLIKHAA